MPSIQNVSLIITPVASSYQVDVGTTINVGPGDVGTTATLMIELWAVQAPGDFASDADPLPPKPLYTFLWQGSAQKQVTLTTAGTAVTTDQRTIPLRTLNEDPKTHTIPSPALGTPDQIVQRQDEILARVRMFTGGNQHDSAIVQFGGVTD
jgi:hypothetical protein